jgi:hypothetical protein
MRLEKVLKQLKVVRTLLLLLMMTGNQVLIDDHLFITFCTIPVHSELMTKFMFYAKIIM